MTYNKALPNNTPGKKTHELNNDEMTSIAQGSFENMKTSPVETVRSMYDESALSYSKMMDKEIELPIYQEVLGNLSEKIADISGALIDSACGSGHMLAMFRSKFDSQRSLIGIDISPRMIELARRNTGNDCKLMVGDMRALNGIKTDSSAALINFFAIHHLDSENILKAMFEWNRVLVKKGQLLVAAWEGSGRIDFGEESDIIAFRYTQNELTELAEKASLTVTRCTVEPVEGFPMDAIYLECMKE